MRFTAHTLLQDFLFLKQVISELDDTYFPYLTKAEVQEEKRPLIEECKMDYAFKMLSLLEAKVREDFEHSIGAKSKDPLSKELSWLCDQFRQDRSSYDQSRVQDCRYIPLGQVFAVISQFFRHNQDAFHRNCSAVKGYFATFRNWYAHGGRYFRPNAPTVPDPEELFQVHEEFEQPTYGFSEWTVCIDSQWGNLRGCGGRCGVGPKQDVELIEKISLQVH